MSSLDVKSRLLGLMTEAEACGEVPVACVITKDGNEIAFGVNTREQNQSVLGHAELVAIERASKALGTWRLNECELFVSLEPCLMCLGAIQQSRVLRVTAFAADLKAGALSLGYKFNEDPRTNHRFSVAIDLSEPLFSERLSAFFRAKREQ